jgi:glyoxylase-like metal-dependent hydrolase (beta-lactamase superfamily II)
MDQHWEGGGGVDLDIPVIKLALGTLSGPLSTHTPITAFAIRHPVGTVLVDTGIGTPAPSFVARYPTTARSVTDVLAEHGIAPSDVIYIVNSHLHTDHCGENSTFDVPAVMQRAELERARVETPDLGERFDFPGAKHMLLDGDTELLPGVTVLHTPGHTIGHQSVLVRGRQTVLIAGDAAYTSDIFHRGAAAFRPGVRELQIHTNDKMWNATLDRLRGYARYADDVFFAHDGALTATNDSH